MSENIFFMRRSVRSFNLEKQVSNEDIEYILKAGMHAPSAHNSRNWEFVIVQNRETLDKMSTVHPYAKALTSSPIAIVACGDLRGGEREANDLFWQQNVSAAIENILLAATFKGIGTLWMGIAPYENLMKSVRETLTIPEYINPVGIIALGYAKTDFDMSKRPDRFEKNKIHYEKY